MVGDTATTVKVARQWRAGTTGEEGRRMRVLITGGAGFIGSHLCRTLLDAGDDVRVLDNLSTGKRENLPEHRALEFVAGDVRDVQQVSSACAGCDVVVHLAAVASVQASVEDPAGTHATNFLGTLNLLEAARRKGARRFIYASSAAVYGNTTQLPVSEDAVLSPLSPYASDKLAGEHYLFFYGRKYGLACTAFRFFNVYGPRQDPSSPYSGVISIFVDRMLAGRAVTIFGDGKQTRDFVYVGDLVDILAGALADSRTAGHVINVGRGVECSLLRVLEELERIFERTVERQYEPARLGDIRSSCADVTRLQRLMGDVPSTPIGTGLERLVADGYSNAMKARGETEVERRAGLRGVEPARRNLSAHT
jgi:UDP-glucose 4-epimerase